MEAKAFVSENREKEIAPSLFVRWEPTDDPKRILIVVRDQPSPVVSRVAPRKKRARTRRA